MNNISSKIFWHFTGSPSDLVWNNIYKPSDIIKFGKLKSLDEAINILKMIIESKTLKAKASEYLFDDRETSKFCCVTDIPLKFLDQHKDYYGKVAIGFSSKKIYENFNPVLYLKRSEFLSNSLELVETDPWKIRLEDLGITHDDAINNDFTPNPDGTYSIPFQKLTIEIEEKLKKYLTNYIKFSYFSDEAGESFYQEKEWRKIGNFYFDHNDIEAVIVPKNNIDLITSYLTRMQINQVSILSWDVIEKS